jgi:Family of unknown function (DUF5372)
VTITHSQHPFRGQQVEVVRLRRAAGGADPDLIVRLPDGVHAAIAMSSTDYGGAAVRALSAPLPATAVPPPLLDLDGLRQAAQLIEQLRRVGRGPAAPAALGGTLCG